MSHWTLYIRRHRMCRIRATEVTSGLIKNIVLLRPLRTSCVCLVFSHLWPNDMQNCVVACWQYVAHPLGIHHEHMVVPCTVVRNPGIGDGVLTVKVQAINVCSHDPCVSAVGNGLSVKWAHVVTACFYWLPSWSLQHYMDWPSRCCPESVNTSGRHHVIFVASGLNPSQSGGDSPGPGVLSTLTISNVEEMDGDTYTCSMMELTGPNSWTV